MKRRIFLSYGHDDHVAFARKLKSDLEARGHEVWVDEERLLPGEDWEAGIERGIEWACSKPELGRVVLLMTPHAVRRPDGYCLNELSRAVRRGLRIVPAMVIWCEPPLSIDRIQWLDLRDCVPLDESNAAYQRKFGRLAEALENDALDFDGTQARLLKVLDPLAFDAEINQHVRHFAGRQWIFDAIDVWLADKMAERIFFITGQPGFGKTALAAKLAWSRPEIAAVHFCRFGHAQKADPRRCVMSIAYHLAMQLPGFETRLSSLPLADLTEELNAKTLFDRLVVQPLSNLADPGRTLVLLIDALDEASEDGENELASFLVGEFERTPPWLRLIVTSRPNPEVLFPLQGLTSHVLDASSAGNEEDMRLFLRQALKAHLLDLRSPEAVVDRIVELSEGNFLYVDWLRKEVDSGRASLSEVDTFPKGLGAIYSQFVVRQWPDAARFRDKIAPALEVIAAARDPLPLEHLTKIFHWSKTQELEFVRSLGSLFIDGEGGLRAFHKSLLDWLTDPKKAGKYFIEEKQGHARLAEIGFESLKDSMQTATLPIHAAKVGRIEELALRFADRAFIRSEMMVDSDAGEDRRRQARHQFRAQVADLAKAWPKQSDASALWQVVESFLAIAWGSASTSDWNPHLISVWDDIGRPVPAPGMIADVLKRYQEWIEGILLLVTAVDIAHDVARLRPELVPNLPLALDDRLLRFIDTEGDGYVTKILLGTAGRDYESERNMSFLSGSAGAAYQSFKNDPGLADWSKRWGEYFKR